MRVELLNSCWTNSQIYIPNGTSSISSRAIIGTGGYILKVSIMTRSKYLISNVSKKVQSRSESPKICFCSSTTLAWMSLWIPIKHKKKLDPAAVVSWPSKRIVLTWSKTSCSVKSTSLRWALLVSWSRNAKRFFSPISFSSTSSRSSRTYWNESGITTSSFSITASTFSKVSSWVTAFFKCSRFLLLTTYT